VLRAVLVGLGGESAERGKHAALQGDREMIDSLDRIGEMLEDVHGRDHYRRYRAEETRLSGR